MGLEALACSSLYAIEDLSLELPTLRSLKINKVLYLEPRSADFARLHRLWHLSLRTVVGVKVSTADLAQLTELRSLRLDGYKVIWASENPGLAPSLTVLCLSQVRLVSMTPRLDLRTLTLLKTLALNEPRETALWLPPQVVEIDVSDVIDLDSLLWQANLAHVKQLKLDAVVSDKSGRSWERLFVRLLSVQDLSLSVRSIKNLANFDGLGNGLWAVISRLHRLEVGWSEQASWFVNALVAAASRLRELVVFTVGKRKRDLDPCKVNVVASGQLSPSSNRNDILKPAKIFLAFRLFANPCTQTSYM